MTEIKGPTRPEDHPDYPLDCQMAMEDEFKAVAERAEQAGWGRMDVANALVQLADNHMLGLMSEIGDGLADI